MNKKLLQNFTSLSILQISNYIFPLVTFPYLVRVLGPNKFGLVNFAAAFIGYFGVLTDFGFNFSATREISINRNDFKKIQGIFNSVMIVKLCLFLLSLFIFFALILLIPFFEYETLVYILSFGSVLGNFLFPIWFFQGMERMKYITLLNVTSKALITVLIFFIITKESDYKLLILLNSFGFVLAGIGSLIFVRYSFNIRFIIPNAYEIKYQLKESWQLFISNVAITSYTSTRLFVVGIFTNFEITGFYAISEKIMNIIQTLPLTSFLRTLFPYLTNMHKENKTNVILTIKKIQSKIVFFYVFIIITTLYFSPQIIKLITGLSNPVITISLRVLLLTVLIINSNSMKIQYLIISGNNNIYMRIHIVSGLIGIISISLFTYLFSFMGTVFSILFIELFILIYTTKKFNRIISQI